MLQFIEYPKCSTCRKAKAELNQLGVDFEAVDIVQNTPSRDQLLDWILRSRPFSIPAGSNIVNWVSKTKFHICQPKKLQIY